MSSSNKQRELLKDVGNRIDAISIGGENSATYTIDDRENNSNDNDSKKRAICGVCDRSFASPSSLKRHKNDVHGEGGGAKFACPDCSQTFKRTSHLESHRLRRHSNGEKPYFCEFCSKSFADGSLFKRHQRAHKQETPFLCPYCQKGFAHSKTQLRNHVMTHTGERPFRCPSCGKGFITKVSMTKHSKKCRKDVIDNDAGEEPMSCSTKPGLR